MSLLNTLATILAPNMTFVDVGAYCGDFAESVLRTFPEATGLLFEPTPSSHEKLTKQFELNGAIHLFDCALSDQLGTKEFFSAADAATNSLLPFAFSSATVKAASVQVETLDHVLSSWVSANRIDFIKIDTQGNDLKVLQGARYIIGKDLPAILVEAIFISLYQQQACYYELFDFMKQRDYRLAGIFDSHTTKEGVLAFADLLFVSSKDFSKFQVEGKLHDSFVCQDPEALLRQNRLLETVCQERLELIQNLTKEAEERLRIIRVLDAENKRISGRRKN